MFNCSKEGQEGEGGKMSPMALAGQYAELAAVVRSLLPGTQLWGSDSSITGDVEGQCHDYYGADIFGFNRDLFAQPGWADLLNAHTWHYYSQDSRNASSTAELILSAEYQARLPAYDAQARAAKAQAAPALPIVMGETASYWAGGRANVSNRFASAFWYVPQLGYLASKGYLAHVRQDLAGGDYGLLDLVLDASGVVVDFAANPDYFTHALWQRLVAGVALEVRVSGGGGGGGGGANGSAGLRAWGACAARAAGGATGGVVFVIVNFDAAPATVSLALEGAGMPAARGEYVLTPGQPSAGLASATVALNGRVLAVGADNELPPLPPRVAGAQEALVLPPQSYAFVTLPEARAPGCQQ